MGCERIDFRSGQNRRTVISVYHGKEMLVYQYYSEGFFGYGQEGDFHPYGIWHLIPLLLLAAAVYFTWKNHARLKGWKYEGRFRYLLSFVMLMAEMAYYWRLLYVGDEYGEFQMLTKLPIQVCQWGLICCVYMITSQNDTLFGINFFITLGCTGIALFLPQTVISCAGPRYFRYYQFWFGHALPVYSTLYMMIVHGKRPRYRHLWYAIGCLALAAIPSYFANEAIPAANYLYVKTEIPLLPQNQLLRMLSYFVIISLLFHGMWFIWMKISRQTKKESGAEK